MSVEAIASSNPAVSGAIRKAADATGVSFNYLLATAKVESGLNPRLTTRTSTATGLFQFLDQTWLGTLKEAGPALGYGNYAAAIRKLPTGRYEVADLALRREIMELRKDPAANSLMGGAFTQQNAATLSKRIGRAPSESELYIAHFLGPYAGAKAINLAASNPTARAADIFPAAARANTSIFFDRQGRARSVAGVCAELDRRYQVARAGSTPAPVQVAEAPRPPAPIPVTPVDAVAPAAVAPAPVVATLHGPASLLPPAATAFAPEPVATVNTPSTRDTAPPAVAPPLASAARVEQAFHSLFHSTEPGTAVAPVVAQLWGGQSTHVKGHASAQIPVPGPQDPGAANGRSMLELFRDLPPNARARYDGKA